MGIITPNATLIANEIIAVVRPGGAYNILLLYDLIMQVGVDLTWKIIELSLKYPYFLFLKCSHLIR